MKRTIIEDGNKYVVITWSTRDGHPSLYEEFVANLSHSEQVKIVDAVARLAEMGPPTNPKKGGPMEGVSGAYKLKEHQLRVPWFYSSERVRGKGVVVITHGYRKKTRRTPPSQISRTRRLMKEYTDAFGG